MQQRQKQDKDGRYARGDKIDRDTTRMNTTKMTANNDYNRTDKYLWQVQS